MKNFKTIDGWNTEALEECGLMDTLQMASRIEYELRNCRRGSYEVSGTEPYDLILNLEFLIENLTQSIEAIQYLCEE